MTTINSPNLLRKVAKLAARNVEAGRWVSNVPVRFAQWDHEDAQDADRDAQDRGVEGGEDENPGED